MPRSSLEAFSALWRAYGEGRLDRSLDLVADNCEVRFFDGTTVLRGHDGVREWLAAKRRQWKSITVSYDEVHEERPGSVVGVGGSPRPPRTASSLTAASRSWPSSPMGASCAGRC